MTARHGARAALALGLAASLAGNVLAAEPTALGRLVAAWPPAALLVSVELITRIPARAGKLGALRLGSAGVVAAIAAWASYWHLVELARQAGEGGVTAHILPLSVDGLIAVASVCLRELAPAATVAGAGRVAADPPAPAPAASRSLSIVESRAELPPAKAPTKAPELADVEAFATAYSEAVAALEKPTGRAIASRLGMGERTYYRRLSEAKAAGLIAAGDPDAELAQMTQPSLLEASQ